MNLDAVRRIADAVLYEGYILYPYRASAQKNRSRWQLGVVMAPGYAAVDPSEASAIRTEWVVEHSGRPSVHVILRFLQVQRRSALGHDRVAVDDQNAHEFILRRTLGLAQSRYGVRNGQDFRWPALPIESQHCRVEVIIDARLPRGDDQNRRGDLRAHGRDGVELLVLDNEIPAFADLIPSRDVLPRDHRASLGIHILLLQPVSSRD